MKLEIDEIAAPRSFIFLWCGSGEGLDLGRVVSWCLLFVLSSFSGGFLRSLGGGIICFLGYKINVLCLWFLN